MSLPSCPRRRVYVDMDDVLTQTALAFLDLLAQRFGKSVAFDQVHSFDLGVSFDLDPAELADFLEAAHEDEVLLGIEPMPGAVEALAGLREEGHDVWVVTGRPPATREVSREWLDAHGFSYSSLRFVDKYSRYYKGTHGGPQDALTLDQVPALGFHCAVEDFLDTALFLAEEVGIPVALVDRPWNRDLGNLSSAARRRITRCHGWGDVLATISRIS